MDKLAVGELTRTFNNLVNQIPGESFEFWYARDIMTALGYDRWENFSKVIQKATISCEKAGVKISNHFRGATKMVCAGGF